jgi:hypothetical protein
LTLSLSSLAFLSLSSSFYTNLSSWIFLSCETGAVESLLQFGAKVHSSLFFSYSSSSVVLSCFCLFYWIFANRYKSLHLSPEWGMWSFDLTLLVDSLGFFLADMWLFGILDWDKSYLYLILGLKVHSFISSSSSFYLAYLLHSSLPPSALKRSIVSIVLFSLIYSATFWR